MPEGRKYSTLAEEIGHYETSVGDIPDQASINNRRQENVARKWAYIKILPIENILFALQKMDILKYGIWRSISKWMKRS